MNHSASVMTAKKTAQPILKYQRIFAELTTP